MSGGVIARELHFAYPAGGFELRVPELRIARGERVGLRGPSGSGKSTVLDLIAGQHAALDGSLRVADRELVGASERARRAWRLASVGVVFQDHPLIEALSLRENVLLPLRIAHWRPPAGAKERAAALLHELGLGDRLDERPGRLSMGERRRVGVARALIGNPAVLLADEPTSGLDPDQAAATAGLLLRAAEGRTLVVASHDPALLARLDRVVDVAPWGLR